MTSNYTKNNQSWPGMGVSQSALHKHTTGPEIDEFIIKSRKSLDNRESNVFPYCEIK